MMSESMQQELGRMLERINNIPDILEIKREQIVDRIKTNLVDAGDKVNQSNDGLIEQLRKFVEQKNIAESKYLMRSIEAIEVLLIEQKENLNTQETYMEIDGLPRPVLFMERPLFSPPVKVIFEQTEIEAGTASADTQALFDQFYVDIELLRNNVNTILRSRSQISLSALLDQFEPTKGVAEILGYMQI